MKAELQIIKMLTYKLVLYIVGFERLEIANFHRDLYNWVTMLEGTVCQFNLSFLVVATLIPVLNFYSEDLENWQQFLEPIDLTFSAEEDLCC